MNIFILRTLKAQTFLGPKNSRYFGILGAFAVRKTKTICTMCISIADRSQCGRVVSALVCQAGDRGSIPPQGEHFTLCEIRGGNVSFDLHYHILPL